jgi:hypothetical protein
VKSTFQTRHPNELVPIVFRFRNRWLSSSSSGKMLVAYRWDEKAPSREELKVSRKFAVSRFS